MLDFEFMFHGDNGHFHIYGHGIIEIPPKRLIFDPSVLHYLMSHELEDNDYRAYIPDSLYKLISLSKDSDEYKEFLRKFLFYFSYQRSSEMVEYNWDRFYENLEKISINTITDEDIEDKEEYQTILSMFGKHSFYVSMSPKMNLLGDVLAKIIGFSKKTGVAILSKTRRLANLLRERIVTLELPKKFDNAVVKKQEITGQLFHFQGGRAAKFFIGVILSAGGFIHPVIGVPGIVFAFMDP